MSKPAFDPNQPAQPVQESAPPQTAKPTFDPNKPFTDYGSVGQQILTGVEGVAHGLAGPAATLLEKGLSDRGVPGLTPQDQDLRAEANPGEHISSELGGFGIGAFVGTGEAAALSKLGEGAVGAAKLGTATSLGQKIVAGAVRGGAELSAYQGGEELSKAINQDPNQTLGTAAINVGLSGLLGAGGGAALGAVGPLWKAYTGRTAAEIGVPLEAPQSPIGPDGLPSVEPGPVMQPVTGDTLTDAIKDPKEKLTFVEGLKKQKPNADEIKQAGEIIGVPVSPSQTSASDFVQSTDSALSQSPTLAGVQRQQEIQNGFDKIGQIIDQTIGPADDVSAFQRGEQIKQGIQNKVEEIYQPLKEGYAEKKGLNSTIDLGDEARIKQYNKIVELSQSPDLGEVGSKAGEYVRDVAERFLRQNTVANIDRLTDRLGQEARAAYQAGDKDLSNAAQTVSKQIEDFKIKQIAKQAAEAQANGADHAKAIANDIIREHKELDAKYAKFKEILTDLGSDAKLGKKSNTHGGINNVLDDISSEKLVDKMFDKKNSAGLKRLKTNFPDVFETVIQGKKSDLVNQATKDGVVNHKTLLKNIFDPKSGLSPEIREMLFNPEELKQLKASKTWIDSLPKNVGPSGTPKGAAYMMALHGNPIATIAMNLKDAGIKQLLKFATPAEVESNKIAADYLNNAVKGQRLLDRATKALLQSGEVLPKHLIPTKEDREKLNAQVDHLQHPENISQVGGALGDHLPDHVTGATQLASQAVTYLSALKPQQSPMGPFDRTPPVDKSQQAKYDRALDIAQQPLMVLEHARNGTLLPQDVTTLQTIYPGVHASIVDKLTDHLTDMKAKEQPVPYSKKLTLALLMGSPTDSTMTPQSMQAILHTSGMQVTTQGPQMPQAKPAHPSGSALSQINKVNALGQTSEMSRAANRKT